MPSFYSYLQVDKAAAETKLETARPALEEAEAALQVLSLFTYQELRNRELLMHTFTGLV